MANLGSYLILLFCSCFFIGFPCCFSAEIVFSLRQGQQLRDWEHLLSPVGLFKLGFFNPTSSTNRYLGIWYSKLPNHPDAVWVANPYDPILDSSGILSLDFDGKLRITHGGGQPVVLNPNQAALVNNVTASLLDNGNFVLRELNSDETAGNVLWQSFDYPTNTLLPGMKLGMNFRTGHNWTLRSWLSDQIPAPGAFRLGVDPGDVNQLIIWRRDDIYWNSGNWESGNFEFAPELTGKSHQYDFIFVSNENEKYFSYFVRNNSTVSRWEVNDWGQILEFNLATDGTSWQYASNSPCKLKVNNPNVVCIEEKPSKCRNGSELFVPTRGFFHDVALLNDDLNTSLALSDCHAACWNNCSCHAYRSHFPNGTGCEFWSKGSYFTENDNFGVLYVLTMGNSFEGKKTNKAVNVLGWWWIRSLIIIPFGLVIVFLIYMCYTRRKRLGQLQKTGEIGTSKEKALLELRSPITAFNKFNNVYKLKGSKNKGPEFQLFSFSQIVDASDNFSLAKKLGEGGFGPVYKGMLDGQQVAVKRLARNSGQGLEEFMNEITLIAELQHMNLVKLLGSCVEGVEKMLIYEYMPNRGLDSFLYDPAKRKLLDWQTRIGIIEGIAQGLLYLHKYSRVRIIHRDLKASNILLDADMNPKISDFGMARIFGQNVSRANTGRVVGTYGYMSPEYAINGIFSVKSDVFSFGVLLLEIISGKKNTNYSPSSPLSLIEHAWDFWTEDDCHKLMDTSLESSCPKNELVRCVHIGLLCVQECAADRPTMSEIIFMLTNESTFLPDPKQPAYYVGRSEIGAPLPNGKSDMYSINFVSTSITEPR